MNKKTCYFSQSAPKEEQETEITKDDHDTAAEPTTVHTQQYNAWRRGR